MIAYVEGRIADVSEGAVVILTDGGVGYEVEVPSHTLQALPEKGERTALWTALLVREDMLRLCGFATREEKKIFDVLTSIPKVGPKLALSILSVYRPADLRRIVGEGDEKALTVVSGIGKRTAEGVLRELEYKLDIEERTAAPLAKGTAGGIAASVMDGLRGLGYTDAECSGVVQETVHANPGIDVAGALRLSLKALTKVRG